MEAVKSFKGYGKVEIEREGDRSFRRRNRKRLAIIGVSVVLLVVVAVGAIVGIVIHKKNKGSSSSSYPPAVDAIRAVCNVTLHPKICISTLTAVQGSDKSDPEELFKLTLQAAMKELSNVSSVTASLAAGVTDKLSKVALTDCDTLLEATMDQLNDSLSSMRQGEGGKMLSTADLSNLQTWLSSAVTNLDTCLDGVGEASEGLQRELQASLKNSTELVSNGLAMAAKIMTVLQGLDIPLHRRLLAEDDLPLWVSAADRRLLQQDYSKPPDLVVDGRGKVGYKTITEALSKVPKKSKSRTVILIKEGIYKEKVEVNKSMWNVMLCGEGKTKTIITGSLSFTGGTPTFATPTLVVVGQGFIGRNFTVRNTAGPEGHQAVAMRSGADLSIFVGCLFDAFQDTLYAHSNRQLYKECDVVGTVDFIFGNAAVVFQRCKLLPRQAAPNQRNFVTAQGKTDPNQNTGISIHKCTIAPFGKNVTTLSYLGRPWKQYSTSVVMLSYLSNIVQTQGWQEWLTGITPPSTIFYAEYRNSGPGSALTGRVNWTGYHPKLTDDQATSFMPDSFIEAAAWLPKAGVEYENN